MKSSIGPDGHFRPASGLGLLLGLVVSVNAQTEPAELPIDEKAEAELLAQMGEGFHTLRTPRFVIASDAAAEVVESLLPRFEGTFDRVLKFCKTAGFEPVLPNRRLEGVFFARFDDFCGYAEKLGYGCQNLTGFFFSQNNRMVFYDISDDPSLADLRDEIAQIQKRIERRSKDEATRKEFAELLAQDETSLRRLESRRDNQADRLNRLTVQHELAHQVLYNIGVHVIGARNPGWLVEGLACIFETPSRAGETKTIPVNTWRRDDLKAALGMVAGDRPMTIVQRFAEAVQNGSMIPLRQLVEDARLFSRRDEPHLIQRYAQTWSFVYFLQQRKREGFAAYLQIVSKREVGEETDAQRELSDFESAFGTLDEKLEKQWLSFINDLLR